MRVLHEVLRGAVKANLLRLASAKRGNVVIPFAIAALPIFLAVGLGVDYSSILNEQTRLQNATDSAALAIAPTAASLNASGVNSKAQDLVAAGMGGSNLSGVTISATYDASTYRTTVTASGTFHTRFLPLVGQSQVSVGRTSVAQSEVQTTSQTVTSTKRWPVCLMVTAAASNHSLFASGTNATAGSKIQLNNCMLQVNTANWDAVETDQPSASIIGNNSEFCFHGGYIHNVKTHGTVTTTVNGVTPAYIYPKPAAALASEIASPGVWDANCPIFADPLENTASPLASATCTSSSAMTISVNKTLTPGRYCGNITITGGTVTFSPGFYQIDGVLTISGGSTVVNGTGVTLYLHGPAANLDMSGGKVTLSPSTDSSAGKLAGVAIYVNNTVAKANCVISDGNPSGPGSTTTSAACINAITGGTLTYSGVAYFRYLAFWVSKTAQVTGTGASLIADYVATGDTSKLTITGVDNAATAAQLLMMQDSQAGYTTTSTVTTTTQLVAKLVK